MNPRDDIDDVLARLPAYSDAERAADMLRFFSALIETLEPDTLQEMRRRCIARHDGTPAHETILELIDGELALRELDACG